MKYLFGFILRIIIVLFCLLVKLIHGLFCILELVWQFKSGKVYESYKKYQLSKFDMDKNGKDLSIWEFILKGKISLTQ